MSENMSRARDSREGEFIVSEVESMKVSTA